jgi:DNA replication protein DnaC
MLRDSYGDNATHSLSDLIDRLCGVELLHVDDVGAEQTSPWVLEQLYTIVNTRYEDGRAMLLTTNLDEAALTGQIGERTVSRIYEMCGDPKPMFGEDRRKGGDIVLPEPAAVPGPRGRDEDAYWEHGDSIRASRYGRPPPADAD